MGVPECARGVVSWVARPSSSERSVSSTKSLPVFLTVRAIGVWAAAAGRRVLTNRPRCPDNRKNVPRPVEIGFELEVAPAISNNESPLTHGRRLLYPRPSFDTPDPRLIGVHRSDPYLIFTVCPFTCMGHPGALVVCRPVFTHCRSPTAYEYRTRPVCRN